MTCQTSICLALSLFVLLSFTCIITTPIEAVQVIRYTNRNCTGSIISMTGYTSGLNCSTFPNQDIYYCQNGIVYYEFCGALPPQAKPTNSCDNGYQYYSCDDLSTISFPTVGTLITHYSGSHCTGALVSKEVFPFTCDATANDGTSLTSICNSTTAVTLQYSASTQCTGVFTVSQVNPIGCSNDASNLVYACLTSSSSSTSSAVKNVASTMSSLVFLLITVAVSMLLIL